jgi:small subunit ribosomal protein S8
MAVTDTISDFLTRIRNAGMAKHKTVDIPCSRIKLGIAEILKEQGYVSDFEKINDDVQGVIRVQLRYFNREPAFRKLTRISKPGRRVYSPADQLPRVKNGLGIAIISTSRGVMTDKEARKQNVGGEVLCTIW